MHFCKSDSEKKDPFEFKKMLLRHEMEDLCNNPFSCSYERERELKREARRLGVFMECPKCGKLL